jgi:uracil-DNA glycosylase
VTQRDLAQIVEAGWAEALEPVAGRIAATGDFLRADL